MHGVKRHRNNNNDAITIMLNVLITHRARVSGRRHNTMQQTGTTNKRRKSSDIYQYKPYTSTNNDGKHSKDVQIDRH